MTHDLAKLLLASVVLTMPCIVAQMAYERGLDVNRVLETVRLESNWDADAVGDEGMAVGLWQFRGADSSNTWAWLCMVTGHPAWADDRYRLDPVKSSIVALDAIALGYGGHWRGWTQAGAAWE